MISMEIKISKHITSLYIHLNSKLLISYIVVGLKLIKELYGGLLLL